MFQGGCIKTQHCHFKANHAQTQTLSITIVDLFLLIRFTYFKKFKLGYYKQGSNLFYAFTAEIQAIFGLYNRYSDVELNKSPVSWAVYLDLLASFAES